MDTFSFLLRRGAWVVAAILLISTFFVENNVLTFVLFVVVVFCAAGYSWLDNEAFGELLSNFAILSKEKETRVYDSTRTHQSFRDTYYHKDSPRDLVRLLEDLRHKNTHVRVHYGDPVTGLEERAVEGCVNISSGAVQIPLLSPRGKLGGTPLLDHCIVQIVDIKRDYILYQHPTYHQAGGAEASEAMDAEDEALIAHTVDVPDEAVMPDEPDAADAVEDELEQEFVFFEGPIRREI